MENTTHYRTVAHSDAVNLAVVTFFAVLGTILAAFLQQPLAFFLLLGMVLANLFFITLLLWQGHV